MRARGRHRLVWIAPLILVCSTLAGGCRSAADVRIENVSTLDYRDLTVAGVPYGDVAAGEATGYRTVTLRFRYALVEMTIEGHRVNAQTLALGARRFTYRIDILDLDAGHLAVELVRE